MKKSKISFQTTSTLISIKLCHWTLMTTMMNIDKSCLYNRKPGFVMIPGYLFIIELVVIIRNTESPSDQDSS